MCYCRSIYGSGQRFVIRNQKQLDFRQTQLRLVSDSNPKVGEAATGVQRSLAYNRQGVSTDFYILEESFMRK